MCNTIHDKTSVLLRVPKCVLFNLHGPYEYKHVVIMSPSEIQLIHKHAKTTVSNGFVSCSVSY